jgi:hypothetical protein
MDYTEGEPARISVFIGDFITSSVDLPLLKINDVFYIIDASPYTKVISINSSLMNIFKAAETHDIIIDSNRMHI